MSVHDSEYTHSPAGINQQDALHSLAFSQPPADVNQMIVVARAIINLRRIWHSGSPADNLSLIWKGDLHLDLLPDDLWLCHVQYIARELYATWQRTLTEDFGVALLGLARYLEIFTTAPKLIEAAVAMIQGPDDGQSVDPEIFKQEEGWRTRLLDMRQNQ